MNTIDPCLIETEKQPLHKPIKSVACLALLAFQGKDNFEIDNYYT